MSWTIDGTGTASFGGAGPGVVTITTTMADDIILLAVAVEKSATAVQTVTSITDVAGLVWNFRKAQDETSQQRIEEWWAHAPVPLTANNITVNISAATDDGVLMAIAINGPDPIAPFDVNGSLPASSFELATHDPNNIVNTTAAHTMLLGISATRSGAGYSGRDGTGYTHIADVGNFGGSRQITMGAEYKIVTTAQTGVDIDFNFPGLVDAVTIGDALQEASGLSPVTGTLAATDGLDVAAFSGSLNVFGTLAATDGADIAALIGLDAAFGTLAATDGLDVAAFSGFGLTSGTLSVTESSDIVSFNSVDAVTGTLSVTEETDTAALTDGTISAVLAATEDPDIIDGFAVAARRHPYAITVVTN